MRTAEVAVPRRSEKIGADRHSTTAPISQRSEIIAEFCILTS